MFVTGRSAENSWAKEAFYVFFEVLMISQHILAALGPLFRAATCHQIIQDTL